MRYVSSGICIMDEKLQRREGTHTCMRDLRAHHEAYMAMHDGMHGLQVARSVDVLACDLLQPLLQRLAGKVDLLVCRIRP